jgi:hypothetical protein
MSGCRFQRWAVSSAPMVASGHTPSLMAAVLSRRKGLFKPPPGHADTNAGSHRMQVANQSPCERTTDRLRWCSERRIPRKVDLALARFVTRCRTSDTNPQPIPPIIALFSKTTEWHPSCYVLERLEKTSAARLGKPSVRICFSLGEGDLWSPSGA